MGKYNFDEVIDRRGTSSLKFDFGIERIGRDDLLPMWVADMDFRLPDEILADLQKRIEHGVFGYTEVKADYNQSVSNWFLKRHGFEIQGEWNTVVPGVVFSIAIAVRAFTEKGDGVLIQEPVYYPFRETIELNNRVVINNKLINKDGHYEIDFEDFEKKIADNNVKLFLLCSPHNPVGRVWGKSELERLGDICLKHDVIILADEIHSDFIYPGYKHLSFMNLDEKYHKKLILATSPSKTFNIAGLQIANIIIPDEKIRRAFRRENDAGGYSQPNALGLTATASCYEKGADWVDELLDYLNGNLEYLKAFLKENIPEIRLTEPEGTYLVWLDFSFLTDNYKDLRHLVVDEAHLWLDFGKIFGKDSSLFARINIACQRSVLKRALLQLDKAVKSYRLSKKKLYIKIP